MLFIGGFQCQNQVFIHVVNLDPEIIGNPELQSLIRVFDRDTVLVPANADIAVRTDDP